jgi:pyrimidine operon attenuation protein/uracil phosphoribosyltransferase
MQIKAVILTEEAMQRAVTRMAHEIAEKTDGGAKALVFIGIYTRGVPLAKRLGDEVKRITGKAAPVGTLDITLHRDDAADKKTDKKKTTSIKFKLQDKTVVLVDDVLYTGRTVRAALDAIAEVGRPKQIYLAVLVDRGHRELPIKADFVGKNIPTAVDEIVSVNMKETDKEDNVQLLSY